MSRVKSKIVTEDEEKAKQATEVTELETKIRNSLDKTNKALKEKTAKEKNFDASVERDILLEDYNLETEFDQIVESEKTRYIEINNYIQNQEVIRDIGKAEFNKTLTEYLRALDIKNQLKVSDSKAKLLENQIIKKLVAEIDCIDLENQLDEERVRSKDLENTLSLIPEKYKTYDLVTVRSYLDQLKANQYSAPFEQTEEEEFLTMVEIEKFSGDDKTLLVSDFLSQARLVHGSKYGKLPPTGE